MELLVFRTDIKSKKKVKRIKPVLDMNVEILDWCIDLEDIDNVLRIEGIDGINEKEIMEVTKVEGFYCVPLI